MKALPWLWLLKSELLVVDVGLIVCVMLLLGQLCLNNCSCMCNIKGPSASALTVRVRVH